MAKVQSDLYFYHPDHLSSSSWITDIVGTAIQHLQYLPFGESRVDQRTTIWNSRYSFSAKEKDEESGYGYFGARYYDSDLSIWLSVDPMSDKYPMLTPYNYCANNPVKLVDPNGEEFGNWYDLGGNYLGTDNIDDGKVYVVTDQSEVDAINRGEKNATSASSSTKLPSFDNRQTIISDLTNKDQNNPNAENGGFFGINLRNGQEELRWGKQGQTGDLLKDESVSFDPNTIESSWFSVTADFHSHPSAEIKSNGKTLNWNQPPSDQDLITNKQLTTAKVMTANSMAFGMRDRNVYFYNSGGRKGSMSFELFKSLK